MTYNTGFELGRLAVKHVTGLDTVINHADGAVEEAHQVTARVSHGRKVIPTLLHLHSHS
jgi:hypothetical protein